MSGMLNTIVKNHFEVDLNFHPIRVIRFRNVDPSSSYSVSTLLAKPCTFELRMRLLKSITTTQDR